MKKKVIAVMMTMCLAMTGLAGCGSSADNGGTAEASTNSSTEGENVAEKEAVDLTFIYPTSGTMEGEDQVAEEISKLAKEQLNVNLTVKPMSIVDCVSNISLMIAGGESVDIFPVWAMNITTFVNSGYVLDLSDYLDNMPNSLQWVGRDDIACCNLDGYIWGVTTMRERCNPQGIEMRLDILNELGIDPESIKTWDDITDVFAKVKEAYPDMVILSGAQTEGIGNATDMALTCDPLNDELGVLENYGEELSVVNEFETEYWTSLMKQVREWYNAGYISKDMATNSDSGAILMAAGNLFAFPDNYKPNTAAEKKSQTGYDLYCVHLTEPMRHTTSVSGLGYAVSGVTEHPDRAVEVLDWLFGNSEVNDLMNFGVEGQDWVENEEGTASFPEGKDASSVGYHLDWGWAIPNQFVGHLWEGNDLDLYQQYEDFKNSAKISKAYGFVFDSSSVEDEEIACKAVLDEYIPAITTGSLDPDTAIAEMNKKLYDAGLQTIMDEKQKQLDAWASENNVE